MVHQIAAVTANSGTGMAEGLWLAYMEIQKTHLRDLARDGNDTRQNTIILFTDGVPSGVTMYLNNPANSNAGNVVKATSTSGCTNATITTEDSAHMMLAWMAIPGPPYSKTSGSPYGMYLLASTDPTTTDTAAWWMAHGGSDAAQPNPTTPYAGCNGLMNGSPNNFSNYISAIPSKDRYGNAMTGTGYTNSHITGGGSTTSIYDGSTALDQTKVNLDYHWGLAIWNSVDNTATNIRTDSNKANRTGDTQNMNITIFTIGYLGNGGADDGLLKRVANDPASSSYNTSQPVGRYIPASNTTALANAFLQVASSVLRLSQ
jgi:hypothetical protein